MISRRGIVCLKFQRVSFSFPFSHGRFVHNAPKSAETIQLEKQAEHKWMTTEECKILFDKFVELPPTHITSSESLEKYLQARGFGNDMLSNEVAMRVFSMVLTNPLTVSYALKHVVPPEMTNPRAICIGARSESNLPLLWWRETLISSPMISQLTLEMCGPEIIHQLHDEKAILQFPNNSTFQHFHLLSPPPNKCHFHKHPSIQEKLLTNDIFILLNPGYGANDLMKLQWKETLQLLLSTKKIIVCTSHSHGDLLRDLKFLDELTLQEDEEGLELGEPIEMIITPQKNPFSSLSLTYDPKEDIQCRVVSTNDHIYAFRMK